mgnify:CR=1 FL=1
MYLVWRMTRLGTSTKLGHSTKQGCWSRGTSWGYDFAGAKAGATCSIMREDSGTTAVICLARSKIAGRRQQAIVWRSPWIYSVVLHIKSTWQQLKVGRVPSLRVILDTWLSIKTWATLHRLGARRVFRQHTKLTKDEKQYGSRDEA